MNIGRQIQLIAAGCIVLIEVGVDCLLWSFDLKSGKIDFILYASFICPFVQCVGYLIYFINKRVAMALMKCVVAATALSTALLVFGAIHDYFIPGRIVLSILSLVLTPFPTTMSIAVYYLLYKSLSPCGEVGGNGDKK